MTNLECSVAIVDWYQAARRPFDAAFYRRDAEFWSQLAQRADDPGFKFRAIEREGERRARAHKLAREEGMQRC